MYKTAVPINVCSFKESNLAQYEETFRACGIDRIFLCCLGDLKMNNCFLYQNPDKLQYLIDYFKERGYEVGVWINGLGHGAPLAHELKEKGEAESYALIEDIDGNTTDGICPLDPAVIQLFRNAVKKIGAMHPHLIMIDDDFRFYNRRGQGMACACPRHRAAFFRELGKEIPLGQFKDLVFGGGKNRYRDAWLRTQGNSLLNFARSLREALDTVDSDVRLSACACYDTWDLSGTDCIELSRAFAGNTKPYLRTIGKPYTSNRIADAVENTRMQAKWCRDAGIEVISEGDVYPRPRFNIPARRLELFDLALLATNETDGILKYMMDYNQPLDYERGYTARHIKNTENRQKIQTFFAGKKAVGVYIYEEMHKIADAEFPTEFPSAAIEDLPAMINGRAQKLFTENAIPTTYSPSDSYPIAVFGENARNCALSLLKNGAVLDPRAAELLQSRGIDVGLRTAKSITPTGEYFPAFDGAVFPLSGLPAQALNCTEKAEILSYYMPGNVPASYYYENAAGQRFYVIGYDPYAFGSRKLNCPNYFNNYYRNRQLPQIIERLAGQPLPAVCTGHPFLYSIVAEDKENGTLALLLLNPFEDEVIAPTVHLGKAYTSARFANANGTLKGNELILSDIEPFGYAAIELQ